jgi:hypothetical protein
MKVERLGKIVNTTLDIVWALSHPKQYWNIDRSRFCGTNSIQGGEWWMVGKSARQISTLQRSRRGSDRLQRHFPGEILN